MGQENASPPHENLDHPDPEIAEGLLMARGAGVSLVSIWRAWATGSVGRGNAPGPHSGVSGGSRSRISWRVVPGKRRGGMKPTPKHRVQHGVT